MTLTEVKDEVRFFVKENYRKVIEETITHFGMFEFLDEEVDTEEITEYAANLYTSMLIDKIIKWNKESYRAGENVRRKT